MKHVLKIEPRPKKIFYAWGVSRVKKLAKELKCIEIYNGTIKGKKRKVKTIWNPLIETWACL